LPGTADWRNRTEAETAAQILVYTVFKPDNTAA
jgi:hypothetical protein